MITIHAWLFWLLIILPIAVGVLRLLDGKRRRRVASIKDGWLTVVSDYDCIRRPDGSLWVVRKGWYAGMWSFVWSDREPIARRGYNPPPPPRKNWPDSPPPPPPPGKLRMWQPPLHEVWRWDPVRGWRRIEGYQPTDPGTGSKPPSGGSSVRRTDANGMTWG